MAALQLPCKFFTTQKKMDDYSASDMHCGDLSREQLKKLQLTDISTRVDPYNLTKIKLLTQACSLFYNNQIKDVKLSKLECTKILFDELRDLSSSFSLYGPYKSLIIKMITHMQNCNGASFHNLILDSALNEQILNDNSQENSTLLRLKNALIDNINWKDKNYPLERKDELRKAVMEGMLPKFNRFQDNFNGMGITVHDTWATHITLTSLKVNDNSYRAVLQYKVQDHFGLDNDDISNFKYNKIRFFRIWFILQRYNEFGFKPFMTNMKTTIEIEGKRNAI